MIPSSPEYTFMKGKLLFFLSFIEDLMLHKFKSRWPNFYFSFSETVQDYFKKKGKTLLKCHTHILDEQQLLWGTESRKCCWHPHTDPRVFSGIFHQVQRRRDNPCRHPPSTIFWNILELIYLLQFTLFGLFYFTVPSSFFFFLPRSNTATIKEEHTYCTDISLHQHSICHFYSCCSCIHNHWWHWWLAFTQLSNNMPYAFKLPSHLLFLYSPTGNGKREQKSIHAV